MKKKILGSMLASVIFSLIIITTLVIVVANYEYIENVKQEMTTNNELLINILKSDEIKNKQLFFNNYIKSQEIRMTFIDKNGKVLGDSVADAETMENHNNRPEVIDARK